MGQKRMRNHGLEHEADSGGVYDSSLSLTVHWVLFKPTISGFYDIRSFGMGIGGVLDRPTDTLPHGVYGVDHICGSFVLHVQTYFYFEAIAYVHVLGQHSILSLQGCTESQRRRPEALRMALRRIVLLVSHLRPSHAHLAYPPGQASARSGYDIEDDEKRRCSFRDSGQTVLQELNLRLIQ